jgi:hypothetical protein
MEALMSHKSFHPQRRRWLKLGSLAVLGIAATARAQPKRVDENEQQAQALGYKHDAAKVDKAKFKNFQPGQLCSNCNFFKASAGASWGPCDIFAGREVNAKGWCSAWVKKV